jgi:hypothetical protein
MQASRKNTWRKRCQRVVVACLAILTPGMDEGPMVRREKKWCCLFMIDAPSGR